MSVTTQTNGSGGPGSTNGSGGTNGRNGVYAAIGEVPDDMVKVLRGAPDEDELAALVAGIVAFRASQNEQVDDGTSTSLWTNHGHRLGMDPRAARAAWRWSAHAPR